MSYVSASVPGKAVLSGEYAVLRQAPAISVAVDRRATVRLDRTETSFHSVSTPGHAAGVWRFRTDSAGEITWLDALPDGGLRLIEEAWRLCAPPAGGCYVVTLDTSAFFDPASGCKLGLGGSAAAMTSLIGALAELGSRRESTLLLARRAHRALQNGLGSGVDVATGFHGGVIEFRADALTPPHRYQWPVGLAYRFLWSGKSADTGARIRKLAAGSGRDKSWIALSRDAELAASAWAGNRVSAILDVFGRYTDTLRQFSIDHELGIFDAGHDELRDLATSYDVVYKPCGAGGGDVGIALAADERAISLFCDAADTHGFSQLDVSPDPAGIKISVGGSL